MKLKTKRHTIGLAAGKKNQKEKSGQSYTLYDTCNKCPLWVYVELICGNDLKALIIDGEAPEDILVNTKLSLMTEFAELSGNTQTISVNNIIKRIYMYRLQSDCLKICMNLIDTDMAEKAKPYLKTINVPVSKDKTKIIGRLNGLLKAKEIQIKKEIKRYEDLTKGSDGVVDHSVYSDQLAILSIHFKMNLDMNISLSQYASYLKMYNKIKK